MSFLHVSAAVLAAAEETPLPVPSIVFPVVAMGLFGLLAAVTWSYRDVARRHADRSGGDAPQGRGH